MTNDTRREFSSDMGSYGARPALRGETAKGETGEGGHEGWLPVCLGLSVRARPLSIYRDIIIQWTHTGFPAETSPLPVVCGRNRDRRERGTVGAVRSPLRFPARFELDGVRACRRLLRNIVQ